MNNDILAYASALRLSRSDIKTLKITDAYSLHKQVYGLFDDIRTDADKAKSESSGILWADKGGDFHTRQILMLSNRKPHQTPQFGEVESRTIKPDFVEHEHYGFEITLNPSKRNKQTGKIEAIRKREDISLWAIERAQKGWGFEIHPDTLQVQINPVLQFNKNGKTVTHSSAHLKGELRVTDREQFIQSFLQGIGRGKAFGFGLLQIVPLQD
ncbi:MAG: type I-E CRISPR-associated protein Cas6/Cse3/CasE [Thiomicrorhabdus chilensis]|uniref:type I-E CRISPR-associated protein Cas6/Cse3/CasE n=1 Tax=Thiomicrorhabdus chilensis TaxID=63656 RepID=UPI00299EAB71|nr:type I-E CRISPR-associated protein Cas6/Cse3/CasE [Thiomicrorhabdus chilensis]MDX1348095.1 type I-E CRISPR-associated protein Cas6/Cse3/CasE [Thiomicrorhabdus chilensis]